MHLYGVNFSSHNNIIVYIPFTQYVVTTPPPLLPPQVDNNLAGSNTPVLAYPTPPPSGDIESSYPILKVVAEKVPHKSPFAQVFKVSSLHNHYYLNRTLSIVVIQFVVF